MQHLTDIELLDLWERGREATAVARALLLLGAARPELDRTGREQLPLPARDAAILALRLAHVGGRLAGRAECPRCGDWLEFDLDGRELHRRVQAEADAVCAREVADASAPASGEITLDNGLRFRVPCSADLLAVAAACDDEHAALELMRRCCLSAPTSRQWTSALLAEVEARLAEQPAPGLIELSLSCPSCAHAWAAPLDMPAFAWEEFEQRAAVLLDDVDRLAARYHWSEQAILALSPARRRAYLQRCEA